LGNSVRQAREELLNRLRYELVGPESENEKIDNKPLQKYLAGILWPMKSSVATFEDENELIHGKETAKEAIESIAPLAKAMNPSAIGISFLVHKDSPKIKVNVTFGMYENKEELGWERLPYQLIDFPIELHKNIGKKHVQRVLRKDKLNEDIKERIQVEWIVRPYQNSYAISLFLVNRYVQEVDDYDIDHKCIFQPKIIVKSENNESIMVRNAFSANEKGFQDEDTQSNELLYRNESVFAVGHSVSVKWDNVNHAAKRAGYLETEVIPAHEIPMVIPPDWDKGGTLDMRKLATLEKPSQVSEALQPLLNEYRAWIKERWADVDELDAQFVDTAKRHVENCEMSLKRMENGLRKIENEDLVFKAFIFANMVMSKQRAHSEAIEKKILPESVKAVWRPFQLAFFLQNIEGIVDPTSKDRKVSDLLWFPTGGGKTEAYLGLAAFTIGYRRLTKIAGYRTDVGVSVIMRYTLRLLTIQQFQRATTMICACEEIRKEFPATWGTTRFRIGLWVGDNSVPNKFDDAKKVISAREEQIKNFNKESYTGSSKGTPVQLVTCPWCGTKLVDKDNPKVFLSSYKAKEKKRRILISCPNKECSFHRHNTDGEGLPVLLTDEEIYRLLPEMVIATVDKFARMPWQPEIQNLFGKVKGEVHGWGFISNGNNKNEQNNAKNVAGNFVITDNKPVYPPNLIIQDELHLISGPLGTMVGLYETAIDYLSSIKIDDKVIGPKVIASTATIKNANKQIEGLYTRDTQIFPSPGLTYSDSFFAKERPLNELPGRIYVGVFAPGRSMKTTLLRILSNLLSSVTAMEKYFDINSLDPYQTVVGYFNSLRELGGAVRLIEDDVPARMKTLENQYGNENTYNFIKRELDRDVPELTSRIDSGKIPELLDRLQQVYHGDGDKTPVDVLLASNMISVGVDVSRLGLMVVNGQPKTTAEFIQSSSRVGRKYPGLIVTSYNWARPRDISHYEEFYAYHSALYRYVEPISVTPFSSRARDRGLAAVLVSMLRLGNPSLSNNGAANDMERIIESSKEIIDIFLRRAQAMNVSENEVERHLEHILDEWEEDAEKSRLSYFKKRAENEANLLYPIGRDQAEGTFKTPNSMRDVEPTAGIYIRKD
jgi:hypothetical protein